VKIIVIAGGSGSGKSTLANLLRARLKCPLLSEDDYYHNNAQEPGFHPSTFDFDDISARDHQLLFEHLKKLKQGHGVMKPTYCFKTHARLVGTAHIKPSAFLLLEGLHLLCNAQLRMLFDYTIFIDVPDDVRLARRLLRDTQERQRTPQSVIDQYLSFVRPAHLRLTEPSKRFANFLLKPSLEGDPEELLLKPALEALSREGIIGSKNDQLISGAK